ncbi:MAG: cbb3-type cytochrome c oxidase subunit II [Planctomycetota bacterium]|nr:cbb3-type cytochrome c oxidase subunit II [Planctomycetota bacterium]
MNTAAWIFFGVFVTFASAWLGIVILPQAQLSDLTPQQDEISGALNPPPYSGEALRGREVYIANGCMYCHSQQVRGGDWNADLERGWGGRRSHPLDYIHDAPQLLGTMRTGPDLINIGARQPSAEWHHLHLYDPQITSPGSTMAPYAFLYEERDIEGEPSPDALPLKGRWALPPGREVVPTPEAKALVAYLKSLDRSFEIEE